MVSEKFKAQQSINDLGFRFAAALRRAVALCLNYARRMNRKARSASIIHLRLRTVVKSSQAMSCAR